MSKEYTQIHLLGKGMSGRGVRVRVIDADERDLINRIAAKEIGAQGTQMEYETRRTQGGVNRMVVEVTKDRDLKTLDGLDGAAWMPVTETQLENDARGDGKMTFKALFTTKDTVLLRSLYLRLHEVTTAELDAIEGNALTVSAD